MVCRREYEVFPRLFGEPLPQLDNFALKLVRRKDLVGEGGEGKVEVIRKLLILQLRRLRKGIPNLLHVGGQSRLEVGQRRGADEITDDEQEESSLIAPTQRLGTSPTTAETAHTHQAFSFQRGPD